MAYRYGIVRVDISILVMGDAIDIIDYDEEHQSCLMHH